MYLSGLKILSLLPRDHFNGKDISFAIGPRPECVLKSVLANPSAVFSAMFPEKPSVTITSASEENSSEPSMKPANLTALSDESSSAADLSSFLPLLNSVPTLRILTFGSEILRIWCAYRLPNLAYSTRSLSVEWRFAPRSSMTELPVPFPTLGMQVTRAGCSTPLMVLRR